jgi:hypothetical protein
MQEHRSDITTFGRPNGRSGPALGSIAAVAIGLALASPSRLYAKTFECGSGDVPCLIAAIIEANTNGEKKNRIFLDAGTYTLTAVDNNTDGPNGLPSITSSLNLIGAGANNTIIERQAGSRASRLIHVAATGDLTLEQLTLRGGSHGGLQGGGLLNSGGAVTVANSIVSGNHAAVGGGLYNADGVITMTDSIVSGNGAAGFLAFGGGIYNTAGGTVTISRSSIANNAGVQVGGGMVNEGTATITDSSVSSNVSSDPGIGAGIRNSGTVTITNSTFSGNQGRRGGAIVNNNGTAMIINTTISGNNSSVSIGGLYAGGISGVSGSVALQNTILALNTTSVIHAGDCSALTLTSLESLDNNLIGTTTGCAIALQPSDLIGDPGLDSFTDDGSPGNGHYPLLSTSQAIDAGNDDVCPKRDQIGQKRHHPCDIGAIEFRDRP